MRNLLLKIAYSGKAYHGWQVQQNAITVQEVFQKALGRIVTDVPDIKGCSRTDSGVHANEYCMSFLLKQNIPADRLVVALNHFLPADIAALSCEEVDSEFHARYSCTGKEYVYKIWNRKVRNPFLEGHVHHYWYELDEQKLNEAAMHFIGTHNFTSFCTIDRRETGDMVRTVTTAKVERSGDMVTFTVSANGFLYNMVRIMVGTLLRVAQGKFTPEQIPQIIAKQNRQLAGPTAPPQGLYLNSVFY